MPSSYLEPGQLLGDSSSLLMSRLNRTYGHQAAGQADTAKQEAAVDMTPLAFKLRREERRRKLFRNVSFKSEDGKPAVKQEKLETVVKDRFGQEVYVRGETGVERAARELEQWLTKMKSNSHTGVKLDQFKDIKVGAYQSEVVYGSPSYEPYPDLGKEDIVYKGGRDRQRKYHGKGTVEFEQDGSFMSGVWEHGVKQGLFKIETNRKGVCYIEADYKNNKMNGKVLIRFMDDTWLDGFAKDGVLHGFCRKFDVKNRLTWVGMYRNGVPFGSCWKIIRGGGCVVGKVDEDGNLSGTDISYLFPDFRTAFTGTFKNGELVFARCSRLTGASCEGCIHVPQLSEPEGRLYSREISTHEFVTHSPTLPDPYESTMVQVKKSNVPGANDGLFARKKIEKNTIIAFYNGIRILAGTSESKTWDEDGYKIFDPSTKPNGTIDIPAAYRELSAYCASLAHKTNHSFIPNTEFVVFDHPRWGVIPCLATIHTIQEQEEVFVKYGYDLDYCPDWYLAAWEQGSYPVPESMKGEYDINPAWADKTQEDLEQ